MVLDGKIYTMGGCGDNGDTIDTVEAYDPQANSWQRVASMPRGRHFHAAAAMGGKIFVTGGINQAPPRVTCNYTDVYDPQTDAWTELASMGIARSKHASAVVDGKLYVFGGIGAMGGSGGVEQITAERYDPGSDSWARVSDLTTGRCAMVAVAL